ncbi:MAG: type II secretion system F family protein [Alphaproteobacteria bacterium]|nr:type II secretion system F family protein [Alphaproteobacteria bacterium]
MEILVAILAFLAVAGVGVALTMSPGSDKSAKRARDLVSGKGTRVRKDATAEATAKRRASVQENLRDMARQQQTSRKNLLSVKSRLVQAGTSISASTFWMFSAGSGVVFGAIAFVASGFSPIWGGAALVVMGLGLPRWVLGMLITKRQKNFVNQLADGIDVIVRGVKSGLPLNQCLRTIASESPEPLRSEFRMIVDGQAMGVPLDDNLDRMYERMPLPEVNFFNIVLGIQQKTGGNLSEALGNLSAVLRSRKLLREKVKALASEAVASAMIIGSLPFVVMGLVYMVRPAYMSILFTTSQGNLILLAAGVMMSMGIFIMRSMINFKF